MNAKVKFFRNIVANLVLIVVLGVTIFFVTSMGSPAVSVLEPVSRGESGESVSIMVKVNATSSREHVESMLSIFSQHEVRTTFFVSGVWAGEHMELLQKMHADGHEIGNLGFFNKDHKSLGAERTREEIELTHRLVKNAIGVEMTLFTPPAGNFSPQTLAVAEELGYITVVGLRSTDSLSDVIPGDLITLYPTNTNVTALTQILTTIRQANLRITTVSDLIAH